MAELETRRMGRTEMRPKAMGLGGAFLYHGPERETVEGVERALELGIDYFDTYPGGHEDRWGKAFAGVPRDSFYLQAKIGSYGRPGHDGFPEREHDYSAATTRWSVENSLELFRTDYLDVVLIHGSREECHASVDSDELEDPLASGNALDELVRMKDEGIIRHIGIGTRPAEVHRRAIETGQIDVILTFLDYTLLDQSLAATTMPLAREHDVGLILASVLGMGRLTGVEPDPAAEPRAHAMWRWCRDREVNIRHLAMQFGLAAPVDGIVMPGPADRQQVEEAYEAATAEVPAEVWGEFRATFGVGLDPR